MIDCADGGHLWAERYDRDLTDIFAVQDEVTSEIVDSLAIKLTPGDAKRLKTAGTDNVEAYELFLRGRTLLYLFTAEDNDNSRTVLEASRAIDPRFAPAAAALCHAYLLDYVNEWVDDPEASLKTGHRIALEAVALDPAYPWARVALGNAFLWMRQLDQAIAEYEEAIKLDPNFADAYMTLGWAKHFIGRSEETAELIRRGLLLDPNYAPMRLHWIAQAEYQVGNFGEAAELLRQRLARQPHSDVSWALLAAAKLLGLRPKAVRSALSIWESTTARDGHAAEATLNAALRDAQSARMAVEAALLAAAGSMAPCRVLCRNSSARLSSCSVGTITCGTML